MLREEFISIIDSKLEDGTVERIFSTEFEKAIQSAVQDLFRSYGDVGKALTEKLKSVMLPIVSSYDYTKYIVNLSSILEEILKNCSYENRKILGNFKDLIAVPDYKQISVHDLWEEWKDFVAEEVNTDTLEICYDDGVSYQPVEVEYYIRLYNRPSWAARDHGVLVFECEHDETLNFEIPIQRWDHCKDEGWEINYQTAPLIGELRTANHIQVKLSNLAQCGVCLVFNKGEMVGCDEVTPNKEPEPTFS